MVKQKITLTGNGVIEPGRMYSEIDQRIKDMEARGWTLEYKADPLETTRKLYNYKPSVRFGTPQKFIGTETRVKVRAVMVRDYTPTTGGKRHEKQRSREAI